MAYSTASWPRSRCHASDPDRAHRPACTVVRSADCAITAASNIFRRAAGGAGGRGARRRRFGGQPVSIALHALAQWLGSARRAGERRSADPQRRSTPLPGTGSRRLGSQCARRTASPCRRHRRRAGPAGGHLLTAGPSRRSAVGSGHCAFDRPAGDGGAAEVTPGARPGPGAAAVPVPQTPAVAPGQTPGDRRAVADLDTGPGHRIRLAARVRGRRRRALDRLAGNGPPGRRRGPDVASRT